MSIKEDEEIREVSSLSKHLIICTLNFMRTLLTCLVIERAQVLWNKKKY